MKVGVQDSNAHSQPASCLFSQADFAVFGRMDLHVPHFRVLTTLGQQFFVGALLINDSVLQHDDLVGILNRSKTVSNDKHGAVIS
mmetsp:Transcript_22476/g.42642  ORF Transcript_22476/g.42642 Transcript_22476/m.42642 type:complete len:85 (-) Transcript_22476:1566-1820(-)